MTTSQHRGYRGRSVGRVLHFLKYYLPYHYAEAVTVGDNKVHYCKELFATYTWSTSFGEGDVPEFTFVKEGGEREPSIEYLTAEQNRRRTEAIEDSLWNNDVDDVAPVDSKVLKAINADKLYRSPMLWADIQAVPFEFFTGKMSPRRNNWIGEESALFVKIGRCTYFWDPDHFDPSGWLLYRIDGL